MKYIVNDQDQTLVINYRYPVINDNRVMRKSVFWHMRTAKYHAPGNFFFFLSVGFEISYKISQ